METKKFQRTKEDFTCGKCSVAVSGNGYTNHCPYCLWSRHVDVNPGDRQEDCEGMMEPVKVESKKGGYIIFHRCLKCGVRKKNKSVQNDDFDVIVHLSEK